jgi:hypothetical protein
VAGLRRVGQVVAPADARSKAAVDDQVEHIADAGPKLSPCGRWTIEPGFHTTPGTSTSPGRKRCSLRLPPVSLRGRARPWPPRRRCGRCCTCTSAGPWPTPRGSGSSSARGPPVRRNARPPRRRQEPCLSPSWLSNSAPAGSRTEIAQLRPGFGKDAMEQAGPECQRFEVGIHAAFWRAAPATPLFDGAGSLCGETGVVSGLG